MNPTQSSGFNPEQNPFQGIISRGGAQPSAPQGMPMGPQRPMGPQMGGQMPLEMGENNPMLPGKTGDNTKPLLVAVKALHDYIALSTDVRTQNMIRNLISMLTNLISRDQEKGAQAGEEAMSQQEDQGAGPVIMPQQ